MDKIRVAAASIRNDIGCGDRSIVNMRLWVERARAHPSLLAQELRLDLYDVTGPPSP
jgi:hypothetical protein